ncbi:RNA polymerase sigma-70 factor [Fibrisoma montanum]|uniref:RNA polymerase sigma-70 factor n=1 Tax=Fibrisoma montanum TaxID=2305895 RepID=A0A418M059_9BACT|nr:RNA polymerase sigma-70 factor [Fibrisoma montanum]RIV19062.1 RNA polymerase sigma-70 factor [Fibrisoma montanum]
MRNTKRFVTQPDSNWEADLTLRVRAGDERAFEEIFFYYYKHLHAIALKFLKDPELAEDAVQDIFLKLWDNRLALNETYSLKGFLSISMRNHVLNVIRNNHAEIWESLSNRLDTDYTNEETAADDYQWREYGEIVERGLTQLSPQKQHIFRLKVFQGLDNAEVARQLSISINTVKFQFSQATKFMKSYLGKHADIEGMLPVLLFLLLNEL